MLGSAVIGARTVDLFAGSGALGIEALSRGAAEVVFVERSKAGLACIRANLEAIGAARRSRVVADDARRVVATSPEVGEWTLVLLDPPYGDPALESVLRDLDSRLPAGARVVAEHAPTAVVPGLERLAVDRERRYGSSSVTILIAR